MGQLYIESSLLKGKTIISDSRFTSPFKITKPFYSGDFAEIMIMQASAGILEGDRHELDFYVRNDTKLKITGQSYTKIFCTDSGAAYQKTKIRVDSGAELHYLPCPVIPFSGSNFTCENNVYVTPGSKLALWDIFACGRVGMGERFAFRKYQSLTKVYENNIIVFADNTVYIPNERNLSSIGYFEGYTHTGIMYVYGYNDKELIGGQKVTAAITKTKRGQLLRVFGYSSEDIVDYMKQYINEGS